MPDLRSTVDIIKKRKKDLEEVANFDTAPKPVPKMTTPAVDDDLLSDAAIDAALKKRKASQKKGWLW